MVNSVVVFVVFIEFVVCYLVVCAYFVT